jgi:hypothetical protein
VKSVEKIRLETSQSHFSSIFQGNCISKTLKICAFSYHIWKICRIPFKLIQMAYSKENLKRYLLHTCIFPLFYRVARYVDPHIALGCIQNKMSRVATATFWHTFHHDRKIVQAGEGGGARPSPFTISTITNKVVVYALAERVDTLPPISTLLLYVLCGTSTIPIRDILIRNILVRIKLDVQID